MMPAEAILARYAAENDTPIGRAMVRQCEKARVARSALEAARKRWQLLSRIKYGVPLHEWAEALGRGGLAVEELLRAYDPAMAHNLRRLGETPRCPPWASRRYRTAV